MSSDDEDVIRDDAPATADERDLSEEPQLPPLRKQSASAKRKRSTYSGERTSEYDSMKDFVVEDEEDDKASRKKKKKKMTKQRGRSRSKSYDERDDLSEADEDDEKSKKKKSKYKIHIPTENLPEPVIQYGTQVGDNPDSSPYRIRGPQWKFPRPSVQNPVQNQIQRPVEVVSKPQPMEKIQVSLHDFTVRKPGPPQQTLNFSKAVPPAPAPTRAPAPAHLPAPPRPPPPPVSAPSPSPSPPLPQPNPIPDIDIEQELADLPSDAFSSEPEDEPSKPPPTRQPPGANSASIDLTASQPRQRIVAPVTGLRQTTLFGGSAPEEVPASQVNKVRNYRVDMPPEEPTHHAIDREALKRWVYPTNLGTIRDYQYSIVKGSLFNNTLVALPTGLGKTFIAATIMLNYFRWFPKAQIVFMAPTRPLCAQQIEACYNIVGIPRSSTTLLTGEVPPPIRAEEWEEKRVFFLTPQTFDNDLRTGIADPKRMVLLVVDEAHRAKGNYSYVKVVKFLRRFNKSFRVLALTATPGSTVEAVQEVIDGLEISKVEIRTEESIDIRQFTHRRDIQQVKLDCSDEMNRIKELLSNTLQPLVNQLANANAYYNRDPMALTAFGLISKQQEWFNSVAARNATQGYKGMIRGLFAILAKMAHSIKLLNYHGLGPFYHNIKDFKNGVDGDGEKAGKYRKQINDNPDFKKMMDLLRVWINKDDFVGHPKITYLCDAVLNHFLDAGAGSRTEGALASNTRVIVFSEYRASAEEIVRVLNRHKPMVKASVFVGQADSKGFEGMSQNKQQETIEKFKSGVFNVLVATSIGEEGLDIGQVDLIICYDASASPTRMLQRMGRTGRKRAGNIVLLLMKGKEENDWAKAQDNYEKMQKLICDGSRFNFRHDLSARIIPRDIVPEVEKRDIEIPKENVLDSSMPDPKRKTRRGKKKMPPKKFHMPDGVQTGFQRASKMANGQDVASDEDDDEDAEPLPPPTPFELTQEQQMEIPPVESVFLSQTDVQALYRNYLNVRGDEAQEIEYPDTTRHVDLQRSLRKCKLVRHGIGTKRFVKMMKAMHGITEETVQRWRMNYQENGPNLVQDLNADIASNIAVEETEESDVEIARSPSRNQFILSAVGEEDLSDNDGGELLINSSPPAPAPRRQSTNKSKPSQNPLRYTAPSDTDTTVVSDSDFDFDSDLADFVVPDDQDPYQHGSSQRASHRNGPSRSSRSTSPPAVPLQPSPRNNFAALNGKAKAGLGIGKGKEGERPFFEPTNFAATQESVDGEEMPELGALLGQERRQGQAKGARRPLFEKDWNVTRDLSAGLDDDEDEDEDEDVKIRAPKRRRVVTVADSDGDSD